MNGKNYLLYITKLGKFDDLKIYFEKFAGFDNVRLVKVKNLAFIEFESEDLAKIMFGSDNRR